MTDISAAKVVHLAFITDEGFALPTVVAISSAKRNRSAGTKCRVHVICAGVSEKFLSLYRSLSGEGFEVDIIDVTNDDFSRFNIKNFAVTPTAVNKFRLPELLPTVGKALYIDGDAIVRQDLTSLFATDISGFYVGAVSGRGGFFTRGLTLEERLNYQHADYFNSGVLLLNLELMRKDGVTKRLFDYRANERNDFMDQDAFNVVLGAKAKMLPLRYNTTGVCLRTCDPYHINRWYPDTHVESTQDAFDDSVIYHYTYALGMKPWREKGVPFHEAWEAEYNASPLGKEPLNLVTCEQSEYVASERLKSLVGPANEKAQLSLIVPVRNCQKTIVAYLTKLLDQPTFPYFELICVDDGSDDNTSVVILNKATFDPRLRLVSMPHLGREAAQYRGEKEAKTDNVIFLDPSEDVPDLSGVSRHRKRHKMIRLNYFCGWPNLGDAFSPLLVFRLSGLPVTHGTLADAELSGIGSVLSKALFSAEGDIGYPLHVWGSGLLKPLVREAGKDFSRELIVHAVRGEKTVETLKANGLLAADAKPALGDPGILCPDLVPGIRETPKTADIAFIPHRYDQLELRPLMAVLQNAGYSVSFVDVIRDEPVESLKKIASARKVLSSSLHGLIFADALGVPNRRVVSVGTRNQLHGDFTIPQFKFDDYYSAYGMESPAAIPVEDLSANPKAIVEGITDSDKVSPEKVEAVRQGLLDSFPYPMADNRQKDNGVKEEFLRGPVAKRLRVLMVCKPMGNPFMPVIYNELQNYDIDLDVGVHKFWICNPTDYDLVHFQWAEFVGDYTNAQFFKRIDEFKQAGAKIIYTRHNSEPHLLKARESISPTARMEMVVDGVLHMGRYSIAEFKAKHPEREVRHYLVPHHLYEQFNRTIDRNYACRRLGLDPNRPVVLAFGDFRFESEKELVNNAVRDCGVENIQLLAPRLRSRDIYISEAMLPYYFAAADVVFVQRISTLNSGNLPMGYYFGKVVVGPDEGNVAEWLIKTGNPAFDTRQSDSAARALAKGLELAREGNVGAANQNYADREWNAKTIGEKIISAYADLCGVKPIMRTEADPSKLLDISSEFGHANHRGEYDPQDQAQRDAKNVADSNSFKAELNAQRGAYASLTKKADAERAEVLRLRGELRGQRGAYASLTKKADAERAEVLRLREELGGLRDAYASLAKKADAEHVEALRLRGELRGQCGAYASLTKKADAERAEVLRLRAELGGLRDAHASLAKKADADRTGLLKLSKEMTMLSKEVIRQTAELHELRKRPDSIRSCISYIVKRLTKS